MKLHNLKPKVEKLEEEVGDMKQLVNITSNEASNHFLRAIAYKYRESHDRKENSDFLLLCQKDPFGELFSDIYFQSSSEFTFL